MKQNVYWAHSMCEWTRSNVWSIFSMFYLSGRCLWSKRWPLMLLCLRMLWLHFRCGCVCSVFSLSLSCWAVCCWPCWFSAFRDLLVFRFTVDRNNEVFVSKLSHSSDHISFAFVIVQCNPLNSCNTRTTTTTVFPQRFPVHSRLGLCAWLDGCVYFSLNRKSQQFYAITFFFARFGIAILKSNNIIIRQHRTHSHTQTPRSKICSKWNFRLRSYNSFFFSS